jgi:hypothetical protein
MGEKQDGRRIIDNVTQRLVNGGVPSDRARELAVQTRLRAEASGDVPRDLPKPQRERER